MSCSQELNELSEIIDNIHFVGTPNINLTLNGDARDLKTFNLQLPGARPGRRVTLGHGEKRRHPECRGGFPPTPTSLPRLTLDLSADIAATRWADLNHARLFVQTQTSPPDQVPPTVIRLNAAAASSRWGSARDIRLNAHVAPNTDIPKVFDPALAWWTNAQPYHLRLVLWPPDPFANAPSRRILAVQRSVDFGRHRSFAITNFVCHRRRRTAR